jgi:group II intron reverse transcriptase/maturase
MPEAAGYKGLARLEVIRKLNARREWINHGLYKLLLDKDMYVLAYERMKSKPGNMTPGTDGDTLDGFSMAQIEELIEEMRNESYHCKPVRTAYIPKSNGKLRKLGIPSTRDKLVQEVTRLILEAVYDSPEGPYFLGCSYGFRSSKSCHGALREVQRKWSGVSWFLEGDIKSCFDDISHEILVKLIERKITDQRFINLIWKILKAGYRDLDGTRRDSLAGTPQGGIVSPILANIYLHELDVYIQQLQGELEKGKARRNNLKYHAIGMQRVRMAQAGKADTEE